MHTSMSYQAIQTELMIGNCLSVQKHKMIALVLDSRANTIYWTVELHKIAHADHRTKHLQVCSDASLPAEVVCDVDPQPSRLPICCTCSSTLTKGVHSLIFSFPDGVIQIVDSINQASSLLAVTTVHQL